MRSNTINRIITLSQKLLFPVSFTTYFYFIQRMPIRTLILLSVCIITSFFILSMLITRFLKRGKIQVFNGENLEIFVDPKCNVKNIVEKIDTETIENIYKNSPFKLKIIVVDKLWNPFSVISTIVISDFLFEILDDEMLNGLILHEVGHVKNLHSLKNTAFAILLSFASHIIGKTTGTSLVTALILTVVFTNFLQKTEFDADKLAITNEKYKNSLLRILKMFQKRTISSKLEEMISQLFSTHPPTKKRIEKLMN